MVLEGLRTMMNRWTIFVNWLESMEGSQLIHLIVHKEYHS